MGYRRVRNIKIDLKEMGCGDVDWIYLAHYPYKPQNIAVLVKLLDFQ